jgi:hypothetical protein
MQDAAALARGGVLFIFDFFLSGDNKPGYQTSNKSAQS